MPTPIPCPLPYMDDVETVPVGEAEDIEQILEIIRQTLKRHWQTAGRYRRDVHVKGHGCATGQFVIRAELPLELSQGLFAQAASYPAFVRFSNSAPFVQPDIVPDGRGLAIQVESVPGEKLPNDNTEATSQDFIMVNHPTFLARNVKDYLRLEETRLAANYSPARTAADLIFEHWNPLRWRWREIGAVLKVAGQLPSNPAIYTYFSMVPIRYGQYAAKYRIRPQQSHLGSVLESASLIYEQDAMGRLLKETLRRQSLTFDFQVQLRTSEHSMPIEDATIEWPERESPYKTVAELMLPAQDIAGDDLMHCEARSFSVWNALVQHRPLGGINRVRRLAYALSAAARNAQRLA
jgi:catalase